MTNPTDARFIAACHAMQGYLSAIMGSTEMVKLVGEVASKKGMNADQYIYDRSVKDADGLLAELARTKPECDHKDGWPARPCGKCGERIDHG